MKKLDKNIGKVAFITNKDSIYFGEWGIIKNFDGDYYYIAIAGGTDSIPVFYRDEFRIPNKSTQKIYLNMGMRK